MGTLREPPLKAVDRMLQRWRIVKVRPYIRKQARVLDIGCADGALFRILHNRIGSGVGVDPALDRTVESDRFQLIAGPLPTTLAPAQFDAVTLLAVVEHLPADMLPALRDQCSRLLKPGGVLLITVPAVRVDGILRVLTRLRLVAGMSLHEHHGFDPTEVPRWFGGMGLTLVTAKTFQLGLNNLFVFRKD